MLRITIFTRAGLSLGLRGKATLTFSAHSEPFPISFTIDTTDPHFPFIEFSHARRTRPPTPEAYRVRLRTTPQPLGGVRWWFECPRTGHRAVRLFLPLGGHQFWSRYAYGLGYASQREDRMGRAQLQAEKIYRALGGDGNWRDGPPLKPKWMRWATYSRRALRLNELNARYDSTWAIGASRLLARFSRQR